MHKKVIIPLLILFFFNSPVMAKNIDFKKLESCYQLTQFQTTSHSQFNQFQVSTQTPLKQLLTQSLSARLRYLDGFLLTEKVKADRKKVLSGIVANGACQQALSPTPVEIKTLASRIICQISPKHSECMQSDFGGDFFGEPTGQGFDR